jgi:hypothetical protein
MIQQAIHDQLRVLGDGLPRPRIRPWTWWRRVTHDQWVAIGGAAFLAELVIAVVLVGELVQ